MSCCSMSSHAHRQLPGYAVVVTQPPLQHARVLAAHAVNILALVLVVPLLIGGARLLVMCVVLLIHGVDAVLLSRYRP